MIGKVVTGCVAILPYHTATQDRGSECRDFGFISRIVTALVNSVSGGYYLCDKDTQGSDSPAYIYSQMHYSRCAVYPNYIQVGTGYLCPIPFSQISCVLKAGLSNFSKTF